MNQRHTPNKFVTELEVMFRRKSVTIAIVCIVLATAIIGRLMLASAAQHPGHGDHAFYYTVAENLADGRGLVIDYIWNYLSGVETISHYSNDYWMPLTSLIISLSLLVLGKSLFAALLPSILVGVALAVVTYHRDIVKCCVWKS